MMGLMLGTMRLSATAAVSMLRKMGIEAGADAVITNSGSIDAGLDGVYAGADAVISNSGSIDAVYDGIDAWNNAVHQQ